MWPLILPVFIPVAVNWQVVVNYHIYGQAPAKMEHILDAGPKSVGFVDTTLLAKKTPAAAR